MHTIISLDWEKINDEQKLELDNLVCASCVDIVWYDEVESFIQEDILSIYKGVF